MIESPFAAPPLDLEPRPEPTRAGLSLDAELPPWHLRREVSPESVKRCEKISVPSNSNKYLSKISTSAVRTTADAPNFKDEKSTRTEDLERIEDKSNS